MERNINIQVAKENSTTASDMAKTINYRQFRKLGLPVSLLLPPGTVKAASNITVAINVATTIHAQRGTKHNRNYRSRRDLWKDLIFNAHIASSVPWLIMRDFNVSRHP
ncbi:hypothetical protein CFOL_v3_17882 [Cephalotus follicularis]|uniref:Exo_endo_phos domain-containing protein n=1 Tax=Cephalotus follicularis TaxID=3775 RepID=A0A1Q3C2P8_CEPFO|nr:hypothetical protein CFOL_v3_17882 [Cephalotus follicularis]